MVSGAFFVGAVGAYNLPVETKSQPLTDYVGDSTEAGALQISNGCLPSYSHLHLILTMLIFFLNVCIGALRSNTCNEKDPVEEQKQDLVDKDSY